MQIKSNFLFLLVKNNEIVGVLQEPVSPLFKQIEKFNVCIIPVYINDLIFSNVSQYSSIFKCLTLCQERFLIKNNIFRIIQKLINI